MQRALAGMFVAFACHAAAAANPPAKADGFTLVRTVGEITEYTLDANGLRVLLVPQKLAPVVTFMVTYHVGSRNEVTGTTGATHLLEHLMFKGTAAHDRSLGTGYDQIIERVGAESNATTWLDRTNYFATVPSNALPMLIEVEADRMKNLALREEDRRPEMTVVRNEFERGENVPVEALSKEIWAAAFQAHPYHHDTIGWRSDIERVPIGKLRAFYDTYYWPDNATATVIGDFDPAVALAAIKQFYGSIPKSPQPFPEVYTKEPEQTGPRRVVMKRSGEIGVVSLAHKIPEATHADWPAIQVLSAVLTSGKMSRCYRGLTDKNLTIDVFGDAGFHRDPSLHITSAFLTNGVKHADVETKLVAEIEKIKKSGVTAGEVQTAIAGLLAKRAFERDGSFALASEINESIAVGDWTLCLSLDDKLKAVTPADVQRVAKKYFVDDHSVTGWFIPTGDAGKAESETAAEPASQEKFERKTVLPPKPLEKEPGALAATDLAARVVREPVAGLDVLVCPMGVKDIAHLLASVPAGESAAENRALAHLAAGMLERGTKKHDQFAFAELLEKLGATIESKVGGDTVRFNVKCLSKDVTTVVSLLAEQLRLPAFSPAEFEKLKTEMASEMQQELEDPDKQAGIAFSRVIYPKGDPSRQSTVEEMIAGVAKARLADVRAFHAANYGPTGFHLVAVGDLAAIPAFNAEIAKSFHGWQPQPKRTASKVDVPAPAGGESVVPMPDKSSVSVVIGQASGLRAGDPGWLALNVGTQVLGSGFISRLMGNVRDREGLTYGIGTSMTGDTFRPGAWSVHGTFAPALLDQGLASTRRELRDWWNEGVTADELDYRKSKIAGSFIVNLETTEGLAEQLLLCVERGFEVKWLDDYPAKVKSLTLEEVNTAIKQHLDPAKMATVKAGTLK